MGPVNPINSGLQHESPMVVEKKYNPLGAEIIRDIISKDGNHRSLSNFYERSKISHFNQAPGVMGYTKATLKTIWAGLIYILKKPIIAIGDRFGYELFLDKTLITRYLNLFPPGVRIYSLRQKYCDFLLEIQELAEISDVTLLEQVAQNPHPSVGDDFWWLLIYVAESLAGRHLKNCAELGIPLSEKNYSDYIDSLNSAMGRKGTITKEGQNASFIQEGLASVKKSLFTKLSGELTREKFAPLMKIANEFISLHNKEGQPTQDEVEKYTQMCIETLKAHKELLQEVKNYCWVEKLNSSPYNEKENIIKFHALAYTLHLSVIALSKSRITDEERDELIRLPREYNEAKKDFSWLFLSASSYEERVQVTADYLERLLPKIIES